LGKKPKLETQTIDVENKKPRVFGRKSGKGE